MLPLLIFSNISVPTPIYSSTTPPSSLKSEVSITPYPRVSRQDNGDNLEGESREYPLESNPEIDLNLDPDSDSNPDSDYDSNYDSDSVPQSSSLSYSFSITCCQLRRSSTSPNWFLHQPPPFPQWDTYPPRLTIFNIFCAIAFIISLL